MNGEMLKSLKTSIKESELLLISTCLDPRFKDKFFFTREAIYKVG